MILCCEMLDSIRTIHYVFANGISGVLTVAALSTAVHTLTVNYSDAILLAHGVLRLCVSINMKNL